MDSFWGLVYAYGVEVRLVNNGGSSISVFRWGMFPRSAKLFLLRSLAEPDVDVDSLSVLGSETST